MTFRNNIAAFGWGFSVFFLAICAALTYVLIRDGPSHVQINPPDIVDYYPSWFMICVLVVFWLAGCGFATYVASKPCIRVAVLPDKSVIISRRYPFKSDVRIVRATEMSSALIVQSEDDESNPYFHSRIAIPDGGTVDIAEGHDRELCSAACARFNGALGKHFAPEHGT